MLGVESPLVCDILASADENGLMKMSSKSDFEKMKPEMVKFTLEDAIIAPKPEKQIIEEEDLATSEDYDDEDE